MQRAMTDFVRRDLDVVVGDVQEQQGYQILQHANGSNIEVVGHDELDGYTVEGVVDAEHIIVALRGETVELTGTLGLRNLVIVDKEYTFTKDGVDFVALIPGKDTQGTIKSKDGYNIYTLLDVVGVGGDDQGPANVELRDIRLEASNNMVNIVEDGEDRIHNIRILISDGDTRFDIVADNVDFVGGGIDVGSDLAGQRSSLTITNSSFDVNGDAAANRGALYLGGNINITLHNNRIVQNVEYYNLEFTFIDIVELLGDLTFTNNTLDYTQTGDGVGVNAWGIWTVYIRTAGSNQKIEFNNNTYNLTAADPDSPQVPLLVAAFDTNSQWSFEGNNVSYTSAASELLENQYLVVADQHYYYNNNVVWNGILTTRNNVYLYNGVNVEDPILHLHSGGTHIDE